MPAAHDPEFVRDGAWTLLVRVASHDAVKAGVLAEHLVHVRVSAAEFTGT